MLPDRRSLVERVSDALQEEISSGRWAGWLPQERSLATNLGVSRNTLRAALQRLRSQGLIEPLRGQGYKILDASGKKKKSSAKKTVVILSPEPLEWLRPTLSILIDELRVILFESDLHLVVHSGKHYRTGSPALLKKLVAQHPAVCWILIRSSEQVQKWFHAEKIPCLISGSTFPSVDLPSVDLDYHALGAHAAGRLLGCGHRHIMLVSESFSQAGQNACFRGFEEVTSKTPGATATALKHSGNIEELRQLLVKALNRKPRPTGILIASSYFYLTTSSILHQQRLRVPEDVSLICTDSDHFLPFLSPQPCHYDFNHESFARKLAQRVLRIVSGEPMKHREVRLFPTFVPGGSVDNPPPEEGDGSKKGTSARILGSKARRR